MSLDERFSTSPPIDLSQEDGISSFQAVNEARSQTQFLIRGGRRGSGKLALRTLFRKIGFHDARVIWTNRGKNREGGEEDLYAVESVKGDRARILKMLKKRGLPPAFNLVEEVV